MNTGSVFRAYVFKVEEVGATGLELGMVRGRDAYGVLYDFEVNNRNVLPMVSKQPVMYDIVAYCSHYSKARVKLNPTTNEYPLVGRGNVGSVHCEIISRGVATPPMMVGMTTMTSNPKAGKNIPISYDQLVTLAQSDSEYDPLDTDSRTARAAKVAGFATSEEGGATWGQGKDNMNINSKSGTTNNTERQTDASQEKGIGAGTLHTSPNFLQNFLIPLGKAVSLPMNHMPNLIKMIALGSFVKQVIGKPGKRVDAGLGNGSTKWVSGEGIYGLGDEVIEAAGGRKLLDQGLSKVNSIKKDLTS
jgi:hypothetical protein